MRAPTSSRSDTPLVVELGTGTAIVDGTRIKIPRLPFELLALLAKQPGEAISSKRILEILWPDDPVATDRDVRARVLRLRKRLGDDQRDHKLIANRPGFGYFVDLPPDRVEVVSTSKTLPTEAPSSSEVIVLGDGVQSEPSTLEEPSPVSEEDPAAQVEVGDRAVRLRTSRFPVVVTVAVVFATFAGSWVLGNQIGRLRSQAKVEPPRAAPQESSPERPETKSRDLDVKSKPQKRRTETRSVTSRPRVASRSIQPTSAGPAASSEDQSSADGRQTQERREPATPTPDADLLHLVHPATGDHFMTTSAEAARSRINDGYELTKEGRVFTRSVEGSIAIRLDSGTAYIFTSASRVPDGMAATALFHLVTDGDSFFTTSPAAANQAQSQGWSRTTVGYVAL